MVLLITGLCSTECYYCPLSSKKKGADRIFADEWELKNEHDTEKVIREAEYIKATGAGITGGDPLLVWERVQTYITLLKDRFGSKFHIHLYTSGLTHAGHLSELITAGLDEIRFHPPPECWHAMETTPVAPVIKDVVDTSADVALEIPAVPGMENQILLLLTWAAQQGVRWVNLNELEFSETNCDAFHARGYVVKNDISAAVKGSQETALRVLQMTQNRDLDIGVHYCSVSFKDGVQLKNRLKRRAQTIAKHYEIITEDGTLVKGAVYSPLPPHQLLILLRRTYHVPPRFLAVDVEKKRVEVAPWVLEKIAVDLRSRGHQCFLVEEYPTADRLEVERTPLPVV